MGSVILVDHETLGLSFLPWSPSLIPENSLDYLYFSPQRKKFEQVSAKFARRAFQICKIPQQFHIKTPTLAENVQRNVTMSSPQI